MRRRRKWHLRCETLRSRFTVDANDALRYVVCAARVSDWRYGGGIGVVGICKSLYDRSTLELVLQRMSCLRNLLSSLFNAKFIVCKRCEVNNTTASRRSTCRRAVSISIGRRSSLASLSRTTALRACHQHSARRVRCIAWRTHATLRARQRPRADRCRPHNRLIAATK